MRSFNIAATGMHAQQMHVDVISQNLANITTTGYKRQRPEFQDLIYQNLQRVGANSSDQGSIVPAGVQVGLGVKTGAIYREVGQGTLQNTQNPLDVAIQGKGYLKVQLPSGETAYTRDGSLKIDPDGQIVTTDGFVVQPAITIPDDALDVSINASGEVQVKLEGQAAPSLLGQLELTNFINPAGLEARGNNLFLESAASGTPIDGLPAEDGFGTVLQGYVENSNVDAVTEITSLITAQRAYEMNSKVITKSDEMLQALNQSA